MNKKIYLFLVCVCLVGCGATPTKIPFSQLEEIPGKYRIYVYNECGIEGHQGPKLYINEKYKAVLPANSFYSTYVDSEKISVSVKPDYMNYDMGMGRTWQNLGGVGPLQIELVIHKKSDEAYVRFTGKVNQEKSTFTMTYTDYLLLQVSEEQGRSEIANCFRAKSGYYSNSPAEF